jgi:hypothetical protein
MTLSSPEKILLGCVAENNYKYLSQAFRLVRSARWFGGALEGADIIVCVVEGVEPSYRRALESLGAAIRIVPRFDPSNPLFNKIQLFRLPGLEGYDTLLFLDCDTIVVQDPSRFLTPSVLQIKIVDVPTVPTEVLERVCGYFGLRPPERRYRTTLDQAPTIWHCNAGVISCPVQFIPRLIPAWCEYELAFSANPDLLGPHQHHRSQAALALAFIANPVPFEELPVGMNFPLHLTHLATPLEMAEADPVILHYHDLVDPDGYLLPSPYPLAQKHIEDFNNRLRAVGLPGRTAAIREVREVYADASAAGREKKVVPLGDADPGCFESVAGDVLQELDGDHPKPRASTEPVVVCVTGMHRSGTSMVARMIHTCGVYFGPECILAQSSPDNERGFWENVDFVTLNDALLQELGGAWDTPPPPPETWNIAGLDPLRDGALDLISRLSGLKQWGWKDPRNSLTLSFWRQLIPKIKVVICLRNPLEVIQSLVRRGSTADDSLLELWLTYNQELMAAVPPEDRVITHYATYFRDPRRELRRVLGFLGIPVSDAAVEFACATVSDALRHQVAIEELTETGISREVVEQYLAMCSEAGPLFNQTQARLTQDRNVPRRDYRDILRLIRLEAEIEERELLLGTRESELASLKSRLETEVVESQEIILALQLRLTEKQAELDKITNTLGWRLLRHYGRFKYRFLLPAYRLFRSDASLQEMTRSKTES